MNKTGFIRYFGWPEFKSIAGEKGKSLVVLIAIIFISLIAIGLGKSATQSLERKMNDPFIKFVKVEKNFESPPVSKQDFDKKSLKQRFSYDEVSIVFKTNRDFMGVDEKEKDAIARLIEQDSEFFNFLVSPESDVSLTDNNFEDNEFGCVVTKRYLEKLGYNTLDVDYINYVNFNSKNRDLLPIPISGVVKQLPDFADVLISKKFYNYALTDKCLDIEDDNHKTYLQFYLPDTKDIPEALLEIGYTRVSKDILLFNKGIIINKYGIQNYQEERKKVIDDFPSAIQFYDYHQIACGTKSQAPEYFSFSFNSLDSIIPFKKYLEKKHKLKIDMSTIEAKKNFNFFNKLSILLSVSLILFSVFSIYIFTTNLVNNHIDKTKRNLGTLKAFGLGNDSVIFIYTLISSLLVISAFTIAYLLSFLIGNSVLEVLIDLSNIVVDDIKYTNINIIYLIMAFVVVPIFSISLRIWTKLKDATPGDLIYERQ